MDQHESIEHHSPVLSILLHLLPGLMVGGGYIVLRPLIVRLGYPSVMALMGSILLVLLPAELGYLLYEGKKKNGRISLQGVVLYRVPIPTWQYFLWVPILFVLVALIFTLMRPVDSFLRQQFFSWLPDLEGGLQPGYSRLVLVITYLVSTVLGTVLGPIVEEMYFRGYLLPRMVYAGKWAPVVNSLLFGLYHIWTPWMFLTRALGSIPLALAAQRKNLYLAIIVHILLNSVDIITAIVFIASLS